MTYPSSTDTFKVIENEWIAMSDGCRLAARIWLPIDAEKNPVPAVLEYLPYRKCGGTEMRDDIMYQYLAKQGYVGVRVDIRGNGESDGLMEDEYTQQELDDGLAVLTWIATQSWCSGKVGMIGHSWGGFNGLQLAALNPPELKAIITSCSTDDRYLGDIHTMNGCPVLDAVTWSQQMLAHSSRPPDPRFVGEKWREKWYERLEKMPFLAYNWLQHPHLDYFWKHGSVCENYSAIKSPVLIIGGWYDLYTESAMRMVKSLKSPVKGIIGPWEHRYPHLAKITPNIDFLKETVRWFDHWLKGINNGVPEDPLLRSYLIKNAPASEKLTPREGCWIAEQQMPSSNIEHKIFYLGENHLSESPVENRVIKVSTPQDTGLMTGNLCPGMRVDDELPGNQKSDDEKSILFETPPLTEEITILGAPSITLTLSSDSLVAFVAVRICDVDGNGDSTRVSHHVFNINHHQSHENPEPLERDKLYKIQFLLSDAGYTFTQGHRIRLAISNTYWPLIWPSPTAVCLSLHSAKCSLRLPIRNTGLPAVAVEPAPPNRCLTQYDTIRKPVSTKQVNTTDSGMINIALKDDLGSVKNADSLLITDSIVNTDYWINPNDPLSAKVEAEWFVEMVREAWRIKTRTKTVVTVDAENFYLVAELSAYEGDDLFFEKTWQKIVKRDLF